MQNYLIIFFLSLCIINTSFSQINSIKNAANKSNKKLIKQNVNKKNLALEEAFLNLVDLTFDDIMIKNGFLKNESIKIQFPSSAKKMKYVLIEYDKGNLVNQLVFKMNRTAEKVCRISKQEIITELSKNNFSNMSANKKIKLSELIAKKGNFIFIIKKNLKSELRKNNSVSLIWSNLIRINNKIPISKLSWTKSNNFSFEEYLHEKIISGILFMLEMRIKESSIKLTSQYENN